MRIRVRFFGPAAELAGCSETEMEAGRTVGTVVSATLEKFPALANLSRGMKYARNTEYTTLDSTVQEGDSISFLPPVGGG